MKNCAVGTATEVPAEGKGPAVTIVIAQDGKDPGGWVVELHVAFNDKEQSRMFVSRVVLSHPDAVDHQSSRVVLMAAVPAAHKYFAIVRAPGPTLPQPKIGLNVGVFCGNVGPTAPTPVNP